MVGVRSTVVLLAGLVTAAAHPALGQASQALELERSGRYQEAAEAYRRAFAEDRTSVAALLGLERMLSRIGQLESLVPVLDSALAAHPESRLVREVQIRMWSSLGLPDSVAAAAWRWIDVASDSPDPYRQWAFALVQRGNVDTAMRVLEHGRERLGDVALAPEMAQLYVSTGEWVAAAREWGAAVIADQSHTAAAAAGLRQAPEVARQSVLDVLLGRAADPSAKRLGAELLVAWDRPEEGWTLLDSVLPADRTEARSVLRRFAERARRMRTPQAARARGYALERLAQLTVGTEAERARLEAAQAFADAGDLGAARRMLERLAMLPAEARSDAAGAMATLIRVTAESGRIEEAERRFRQWADSLRVDDAARLRERLGWAWVMRGELERAEGILKGDSTIGTQAVRGWIALYRGDLAGATDRFRSAGPFAGSREQATRRTMMLGLIQSIEPDSVPALGEALLWLARGDTARALEGLEGAAALLSLRGGRADVLAFAGNAALTTGDFERAEPFLLQALAADSTGPSAAPAEYALAVVYSRIGRRELAVRHLEHLILTYPGSAVVPEARRLLDQVQGVIPKS